MMNGRLRLEGELGIKNYELRIRNELGIGNYELGVVPRRVGGELYEVC